MDAVAAYKPDLVCLPEIFNARFRPRPSVVQQGEPIDGPTIAASWPGRTSREMPRSAQPGSGTASPSRSMRTPESPKRSRFTVPDSARGSGYWNQTSRNSIAPWRSASSMRTSAFRAAIYGRLSAAFSKSSRSPDAQVEGTSLAEFSCKHMTLKRR